MSARPSMTIQSLLLAKDMFTRQQAAQWAHHHGYRADVESGITYWRLRQAAPVGRVKRTIEFVPGIKAVVQRNAQRNPMVFPPEGYNPHVIGRIPGTAREIRYLRSGGNPGQYKHPFEHPVRMLALSDGSVLLKGRRTIHADDRDRDFDRYVSRAHRRRRNPMARRRRGGGGLFGGGNMTWILVGVAALFLLRPGMLGAATGAPWSAEIVWLDTTDGTMVVGPSQPGPNWRRATQAEIQMAIVPMA